MVAKEAGQGGGSHLKAKCLGALPLHPPLEATAKCLEPGPSDYQSLQAPDTGEGRMGGFSAPWVLSPQSTSCGQARASSGTIRGAGIQMDTKGNKVRPAPPLPPTRAKVSHHGAAPLPRALGAAPGSCQGRFGSTLVPSKRPSPLLGDRKFLEQVGRVPQICSQRLWNRPFHGKGQGAWVPSHSKAGVFSLSKMKSSLSHSGRTPGGDVAFIPPLP